jgi:hypothetical protein
MFKHFCKKLHAPREIYEFIEKRWKEVDFIEWNDQTLEKEMNFELTEKNVIKEEAKKLKINLQKNYLDKIDKKAPTAFNRTEMKFVNKFMQHEKNREDLQIIRKHWAKLKPELTELKKQDSDLKSDTMASSEVEKDMRRMERENNKQLFDDYILFATNTILSDVDSKCKYCGTNCQGKCREWERYENIKEWHKNSNGKDYYIKKLKDNLQPLQLPKYMSYIQCEKAGDSQEYYINERKPPRIWVTAD